MDWGGASTRKKISILLAYKESQIGTTGHTYSPTIHVIIPFSPHSLGHPYSENAALIRVEDLSRYAAFRLMSDISEVPILLYLYHILVSLKHMYKRLLFAVSEPDINPL